MPKDLILINSSNYVGNNQYAYRLPSAITFKKGAKLSLYSFSMYNSTNNISSTLNNNTFSIVWLGTTYNFVIPNGYYALSDLNNYFEFCMLSNKLYASTSTQPVYFISCSSKKCSIQCANKRKLYSYKFNCNIIRIYDSIWRYMNLANFTNNTSISFIYWSTINIWFSKWTKYISYNCSKYQSTIVKYCITYFITSLYLYYNL